MSPDARRQKQKLQPGRGQRSVAERFHFGLLFPVEQHQPAVEVVSQHGELKVNAVHRPPSRRMSREPGIIFCFLNEILGARPLVIEPRQESDPAAYVGDEYAIAVFRGFEQLVLLGFPRRRRLLLFDSVAGPNGRCTSKASGRASTLLGRTLQQTPGFDGDAVPLRFRFQERRQCVRNSFATKQLPAREHPPASGE
jgi:hypothetical protein